MKEDFDQLSGGTLPDDDPDGPVQAAKNSATGLKSEGYAISALAPASDGLYQVEIIGPDGKSFLDQRFDTGGDFSTIGGIKSGAAA